MYLDGYRREILCVMLGSVPLAVHGLESTSVSQWFSMRSLLLKHRLAGPNYRRWFDISMVLDVISLGDMSGRKPCEVKITKIPHWLST